MDGSTPRHTCNYCNRAFPHVPSAESHMKHKCKLTPYRTGYRCDRSHGSRWCRRSFGHDLSRAVKEPGSRVGIPAGEEGLLDVVLPSETPLPRQKLPRHTPPTKFLLQQGTLAASSRDPDQTFRKKHPVYDAFGFFLNVSRFYQNILGTGYEREDLDKTSPMYTDTSKLGITQVSFLKVSEDNAGIIMYKRNCFSDMLEWERDNILRGGSHDMTAHLLQAVYSRGRAWGHAPCIRAAASVLRARETWGTNECRPARGAECPPAVHLSGRPSPGLRPPAQLSWGKFPQPLVFSSPPPPPLLMVSSIARRRARQVLLAAVSYRSLLPDNLKCTGTCEGWGRGQTCMYTSGRTRESNRHCRRKATLHITMIVANKCCDERDATTVKARLRHAWAYRSSWARPLGRVVVTRLFGDTKEAVRCRITKTTGFLELDPLAQPQLSGGLRGVAGRGSARCTAHRKCIAGCHVPQARSCRRPNELASPRVATLCCPEGRDGGCPGTKLVVPYSRPPSTIATLHKEPALCPSAARADYPGKGTRDKECPPQNHNYRGLLSENELRKGRGAETRPMIKRFGELVGCSQLTRVRRVTCRELAEGKEIRKQLSMLHRVRNNQYRVAPTWAAIIAATRRATEMKYLAVNLGYLRPCYFDACQKFIRCDRACAVAGPSSVNAADHDGRYTTSRHYNGGVLYVILSKALPFNLRPIDDATSELKIGHIGGAGARTRDNPSSPPPPPRDYMSTALPLSYGHRAAFYLQLSLENCVSIHAAGGAGRWDRPPLMAWDAEGWFVDGTTADGASSFWPPGASTLVGVEARTNLLPVAWLAYITQPRRHTLSGRVLAIACFVCIFPLPDAFVTVAQGMARSGMLATSVGGCKGKVYPGVSKEIWVALNIKVLRADDGEAK
ncbi:hypothetical protein PR048_028926 [Dryococelus australis]|uniref:C2H2-type domain-containing protein n=1 Tax=Dryococelus australis TaxID=614101 RepID=A0ABQ9GBY2_9NEOP|nr:hypothetical protein PR048_028926 [Dryococelus australis]